MAGARDRRFSLLPSPRWGDVGLILEPRSGAGRVARGGASATPGPDRHDKDGLSPGGATDSPTPGVLSPLRGSYRFTCAAGPGGALAALAPPLATHQTPLRGSRQWITSGTGSSNRTPATSATC